MKPDILNSAKILWDHFYSVRQERKSDVIVVCCSYDLRICDYACDLLPRTGARKIVFSGNSGNWTKELWTEPEAHLFRERARRNGLDDSKIAIEDKATNIGENIALSKRHFTAEDVITYVSKPNTLLRIKLTLPKHLANKAYVAAPAFAFPDQVSEVIGLEGLIHEMTGDLDRIIKYPHLGYQVHHDVPPEVMESYDYLIKNGFINHLLS